MDSTIVISLEPRCHDGRLNRSKAEGFLLSSTPLITALAIRLSSFCFSSFARTATYVNEFIRIMRTRTIYKDEENRTAVGSMTFLRCFLRYLLKSVPVCLSKKSMVTDLFVLFPFPRIFLFSRASRSWFFPFGFFSSLGSFAISVSSALPWTRRRSSRGNRANGVSVVPLVGVVNFDGGAKEPTNSESNAIISGWICVNEISRNTLTAKKLYELSPTDSLLPSLSWPSCFRTDQPLHYRNSALQIQERVHLTGPPNGPPLIYLGMGRTVTI